MRGNIFNENCDDMRGNIFNENCDDTLERIETKSINAIITSPPYNIIRPNSTDRGYDLYKDGMCNEEYIAWTIGLFNDFYRILEDKGVVIYNMSYGTENTTLMSITIADIIRHTEFTLADIIVWKKDSATPNNVSSNKLTRIVEHIYIFCKKDNFMDFSANKKVVAERETGQKIYENVFNFIKAKNNDGSQDMNKATFSTDLIRKLIDIYVPKDSLIYDPFMGTGTTAVAAVQKDCNFIGSELSLDQCVYARKRIAEAKGEVGLFE